MLDRKRRPLRITLFAIFITWMALWNGLRLGEAIFFWKALHEYGAHPFYLASSGGICLLLGMSLAWGIWQGKPWALAASMVSVAAYTLWMWFDRLVIQEAHKNNVFLLIANVILLLPILFILFSRQTRQFFRKENHGNESETSPIT